MIFLYQWWLLRLSVILILPSFFIDLEGLFLLSSFIFLHLTLGLKAIINDYLHDRKSKMLLLTFIKLCSFEFLRYVLEFLL
nr:succinate:cytochrome c oxidoreductase subunit 4 [Phymatolithon calcareum]